MARLLAHNGRVAITAAISPYAATRDEVRRAAEADGVPLLTAAGARPEDFVDLGEDAEFKPEAMEEECAA